MPLICTKNTTCLVTWLPVSVTWPSPRWQLTSLTISANRADADCGTVLSPFLLMISTVRLSSSPTLSLQWLVSAAAAVAEDYLLYPDQLHLLLRSVNSLAARKSIFSIFREKNKIESFVVSEHNKQQFKAGLMMLTECELFRTRTNRQRDTERNSLTLSVWWWTTSMTTCSLFILGLLRNKLVRHSANRRCRIRRKVHYATGRTRNADDVIRWQN